MSNLTDNGTGTTLTLPTASQSLYFPNQVGYTYSLNYQTNAGVGYNYNSEKNISGKRIGPKLYFNYVKSKLNKTQTKKLKARLDKLQILVKSAQESGQTALYEELTKMLLVAVRESQAAACNYDVYIKKADIDKYRYLVCENEQDRAQIVFFKTLEEFPRSIPAKVQKVIKSVKSKGLFDQLHVLYLDYSKETIKSNKEKIREKDPILFGTFNYDAEKFYFITDWIDEYCDLTLSSFVDKLKTDDQEYDVNKVGDLTTEYLETIKKEIQDRENRLRGTGMSNFRDNMEEESELARLREENAKLLAEKAEAEELKEVQESLSEMTPTKQPWYKFW
jgi:DNA polymerase III delta prime subunit